MPVRFNVGGSATHKDTATEKDVRYPKTFHAGPGAKAKVGEVMDCAINEVTPSKENQIIPKGSYIAEDIVVHGDDNLESQNIKSGTEIFGTPGDDNVVDTRNGNLDAANMLPDQIGYSKGREVRGGMSVLTDASFSPASSAAYDNSAISGVASNEYVGAFDYLVKGYIGGKIRIHIANLLGKNIRAGVKIGGKNGYIEGEYTKGATAIASHILKGETAGVNGTTITGTMENVGAYDQAKSAAFSGGILYVRITNGAHITPSTSGYPEITIPQNVLANVLGITGDIVKKGESILGVNGKFEGWVPVATDLYLRGHNISLDEGYNTTWGFNSGAIQYPSGHSGMRRLRTKTFDLAPYNRLNVEFQWVNANFGAGATVSICDRAVSNEDDADAWVSTAQHNNIQTVSIDISGLQKADEWYIGFGIREAGTNVYHIWVS